MARARSTKSKKKLRAAPEHDSMAVTRAAPAVVVDDLAETREGHVSSLVSLLDAGEKVISERGFARASIEDVAHRAGVSIDVFHAHFAGKGALLRALNDRFVDQMIAAVDSSTRTGSWSSSRARDVVEIAVRTIVDVVDERQGLVRAFLAHGATDRALVTGLRKIGTHMTERLVNVLGGCKDAKSSPASARTVGFSLLLSVALAHHCILVGEEWAGVGLTRDELTEELTTAISGYLAARRPS
ncbi:MAG: Transcriptional regulator, TetR family protein [Labilithrix sp.]|nr:Transcriptional regulator, TetR family protein [Labilithrix sp.]